MEHFSTGAAPWWHSAVVYQIYPRSFADSNGDGIGDLRGIIAHLDYLRELGVDVVWLSPVYRSPMVDNGYDIADYQDVDPVFGTLADLDELIAGLHARGMKLVMDLVVNHTSDQHPWFQESRDPSSPKRDWYVWRPARPGMEPGTPGAEPTNWACFFGGGCWQYDEASREYYLHLFASSQPDLNWENPEVRAAVYEMMRWWVDRGVDGFRMDVINLISKTHPLTDGYVAPGDEYSYEIGKVVDGPRMREFLQEMHREVGLSGLFTVGEMLMVSVENARDYTDAGAGMLNMVFAFDHMMLDQEPGQLMWNYKPLHLPDLKRTLAQWQYGLADRGWNSLFLENHDYPRSVSRFGDDSPEHRVASAKTLATVLHLLKGTPYVYQGQELGMTNAGFTSIEQYDDIESQQMYRHAIEAGATQQQALALLAVRSRDNARTPMQWNAGEHAGFTTGTPWLRVNPNHVDINAEAAIADPGSVYHHYRRLIALRHESEAVREGRFDLLLPDDDRLFAYTRTLGQQRLLVVANLSGDPTKLPAEELPDLAGATVVLATHEPTAPVLQPWESRVYALAP